MRRREFLTAGSGALLTLPLVSSPLQAMALCLFDGQPGGCALHAMTSVDSARPLLPGELRIGQFWPAQIKSASLAVWNVDLEIQDQDGISRTIYAWQLSRSADGAESPANGLRMRLPESGSITIHATMKQRDALGRLQPQQWQGRMRQNSSMLLTSSRASTGVPPDAAQLTLDAEQQSLQLADGSARDFDALLLEIG